MTTSAPSAPQSYTGIVGPGQTLPVAVVGTQFYFPVATGQLWARQSGGLWCSYQQGTGQECPTQFTTVEVNNPRASPLVFQIVASGSSFIDHRLVPNAPLQNVSFSSYSWTGPTGPNNIYTTTAADKSGQQILWAGKTWIAINRVFISLSTTVSGGILSGSGIGLVIGPVNVPFTVPVSGSITLSYEPPDPDTSLGANVFEIYQAVLPGFAANPPN